MIEGATIEGFRGLRHLQVDGFGRVNLVIGKNDCGKTALLEAVVLADEPVFALAFQGLRRSRHVDREHDAARDFDRFWRPLFSDMDAERGFLLEVRGSARSPRRTRFRKSASAPAVVDLLAGGSTAASWALDVEISDGGERVERIVGGVDGIKVPDRWALTSSSWIAPLDRVESSEIGAFSRLKLGGREGQVLDVLRAIDDRVSSVEILAPGGSEAELFVSLGPGSSPLPLSSMGDGFQRCFQIGVTAAAHDRPALFVDEIENGLHHGALAQLWRWLALISKKRDLQVFATTHSEECIHAACRAFTDLGDDGLRVIRLDRREDRTTAAVYDRALVETAVQAGVEIRG
jgi:hypothetical protein